MILYCISLNMIGNDFGRYGPESGPAYSRCLSKIQTTTDGGTKRSVKCKKAIHGSIPAVLEMH